MIERHYSPNEIAERLGISRPYAAKLARREPGVIVLGDAKGTRKKRSYTTIRVPESVLARMLERYAVKVGG